MSWILVWYIACGLFLLLVIGALVVGIYRRRYFNYFKVLAADGRTALAGAEVYGLRVSHSYYRTLVGYTGNNPVYATDRVSHERLVRLGSTDAGGCFKRITGYMAYPAFVIKGPGIEMGLIACDQVSAFGNYPHRPIVLQVFNGFVVLKRDLH